MHDGPVKFVKKWVNFVLFTEESSLLNKRREPSLNCGSSAFLLTALHNEEAEQMVSELVGKVRQPCVNVCPANLHESMITFSIPAARRGVAARLRPSVSQAGSRGDHSTNRRSSAIAWEAENGTFSTILHRAGAAAGVLDADQ
jgi:hypothetical protein